jgi:hypothetical protein
MTAAVDLVSEKVKARKDYDYWIECELKQEHNCPLAGPLKSSAGENSGTGK